MTIYVWDASAYDGAISVDQFRQAMDEGIVAFVHRLTRQGGLLDPYAGPNLRNAQAAGIGLIGAYAVTYTSGGTAQDDLTIRQADQVVPWWRTFPGWWWMEDLERWPSDDVSAQLGMEVARQLEATSGKVCALYASHGQYGDKLLGWTGPLVNADYTSRPAGGFVSMYPGDYWYPDHGSWHGGWTPYSGRTPDLLQYTSSATVAGLTTCDVSAYRGTYAQLAALLAPSSPQAPAQRRRRPMFLATDGSGHYWLCDGMTRRPVTLDDAQIIAYGKTSGYGPTYPDLLVGDPSRNPANGSHEWVDLPKQGGGVYPAYARLNPGNWAGDLPADGQGECVVDQDQLSTAVKNALSDPVVTSGLEQQFNEGLADRILSGRPQ